ncbi:MAG: ScbR family autoregulator-binding transcription factor [Actinomycetota bacterium]
MTFPAPSAAPARGLARRGRTNRGPKQHSAQAELTRESILEAAADAFDRRGYLGANLNDTVGELGLTRGALYYFFASKKDLVLEIVERHQAAWDPLTEEVVGEHENLLDAAIDVTFRVAEELRTNVFARAATRLSAEQNLVDTDLPEPIVGWAEGLTRLLAEASERGDVRPGVDAAGTAQMVVSFLYGAQAVSDRLTGREDLERRIGMFWDAVEPSLRP